MNFEELVREREFAVERNNVEIIPSDPKPIIQKSDKGCSLFDCISMIAILVELTMPNVKFEPDEGKVMTLDAMQEFNKPVITYSIIQRETKNELKPRMREAIVVMFKEKINQIEIIAQRKKDEEEK